MNFPSHTNNTIIVAFGWMHNKNALQENQFNQRRSIIRHLKCVPRLGGAAVYC